MLVNGCVKLYVKKVSDVVKIAYFCGRFRSFDTVSRFVLALNKLKNTIST